MSILINYFSKISSLIFRGSYKNSFFTFISSYFSNACFVFIISIFTVYFTLRIIKYILSF